MIIIAVQENDCVYAYDENSKRIINESGTLYNYTDRTVTIIRNDVKYIYDCSGKILKKYPNSFVDTDNIVGCII
mgnify:CR=1 FL=1